MMCILKLVTADHGGAKGGAPLWSLERGSWREPGERLQADGCLIDVAFSPGTRPTYGDIRVENSRGKMVVGLSFLLTFRFIVSASTS